jgi:RNA polymerase sigma-B factor
MLAATKHTESKSRDDEVLRLIDAFRARNEQRAFERIVALHDKLLHHLVRRYVVSSGEPREDLIQVCYMGLVKAVAGYRADAGAKFSSYAYAMMDGEIRHHLRDTALVKKPRWARSLYAKVVEVDLQLTAELGRPPLVEEIAREVNVSPDGVRELKKLFHDTSVVSLDGGDAEHGVDLSAIKSLGYESFSLPIEDRIALEQALESLTEVQRKVVYLFFYKDLSQTEIGRMLSLPQRKISRVITSAIKAMRNSQGDGGRTLGWRS